MSGWSTVPTDATFRGRTFGLYNSGKRDSGWELTLPWDDIRPGEQSSPKADQRWVISSLSAHIEQVGLGTAAQLLKGCAHFDLKMVLAQAVADEARHAEVFSRYAIALYGVVDEAKADFFEVSDHLASLDDFDLQFLSHVALENAALEHFDILQEYFADDFLAQIYRRTRHDEARHVAGGIFYFQQRIDEEPSLAPRLREHLTQHADLLYSAEQGADWLAWVTGKPEKELFDRLQKRGEIFERHLFASERVAVPELVL